MKKLFVSQPMRGRSKDEICAERNRIIVKAQQFVGEAVDPLPSFFETSEWRRGNNVAVRSLARSIAVLGDADVAAFAPGWEEARGCRIEHQVCIDYGIDTVYITDAD